MIEMIELWFFLIIGRGFATQVGPFPTQTKCEQIFTREFPQDEPTGECWKVEFPLSMQGR